MATNGELSSSTYGNSNGGIKLGWKRIDFDTSNSTSEIQWTLYGVVSNGGYYYMSPFRVTIGGTVVWESTTNVKVYNGDEIVSNQKHTLKHNNCAALTFSIKIEAGVYNHSGYNVSGSKSFTLDAIATVPGNASNLRASTTSIKPDGNFTVSWDAASNNGGINIDAYSVDVSKYTISSGTWSGYSNSGSVSGLEKTLNGRSLYSDLMPGDKISIKIGAHNSVGWSSQEGRPVIEINVYKDGKIMMKDFSGVVREIGRIKIKDASGVVRDIQKVKIKDMSGVIRNIDLYWK